MATNTLTQPVRTARPLLAIAVGGFAAGSLDLAELSVVYGRRIPLVVAAGLLGKDARHGGPATYALGLALHFFIALTVAAIYYLGSRRLPFLRTYPFVCGLFYGIGVKVVMNYIVLPLSALHDTGPFTLQESIHGIVNHMLLIGLPISYSVRWFAGEPSRGDCLSALDGSRPRDGVETGAPEAQRRTC